MTRMKDCLRKLVPDRPCVYAFDWCGEWICGVPLSWTCEHQGIQIKDGMTSDIVKCNMGDIFDGKEKEDNYIANRGCNPKVWE